MANGDHITSPDYCHDLCVVIGGEPFDNDCYGLALGSFDMVLRVHWLESLGPILWDFGRRTLAFVRNGHRVLWFTMATPSLLAAFADIMFELLAHFVPLFEEPSGLPSTRQRCHQIRLLPGTPPVTVRPYRYAHTQKAELERQCAAILDQGVIRPSSSTFSALVLLAKKGDGTWRLCVDYRALNSKAIEDMFLIPGVEELLDELRGTKFFSKFELRLGYHQVRMHQADIKKTTFCTH
jgi:hypothetical protein